MKDFFALNLCLINFLGNHRCSLFVFQLPQQVQDLNIQPNQRYQKAKGAKPFILFGHALTHALLNLLVINKQVHRSDANHNQAKQDADDAALRQALGDSA